MAEIPFHEVKAKVLADPEVRREYDALEEEFRILRAKLDAREKARRFRSQMGEGLESQVGQLRQGLGGTDLGRGG
jgi:hypothetical protein